MNTHSVENTNDDQRALGCNAFVMRQPIRDGLLQFYRNGRWGTCVDCPSDSDGKAYPEFCRNTDRYDHQLRIDSLVSQIRIDLPYA